MVFKPEEMLVLDVGTMVDIVEDDDIGLECVLPADFVPLNEQTIKVFFKSHKNNDYFQESILLFQLIVVYYLH